MRSKTPVLVAAACAALLLSGCSASYTELPEYTTAEDRDSDFSAKTFAERFETEPSSEIQAIIDTVDKKVPEISKKAEEITNTAASAAKDVEEANAAIDSEIVRIEQEAAEHPIPESETETEDD